MSDTNDSSSTSTSSVLNIDKLRAIAAEFLATALFVYVGAGSVLAGNGTLGIALAFGLSITTLAYSIGHHSGGHINPAVSLVMASIGKIDTSELIPYMLAQLLGGLVALEIYKRYTV